MHHRLRERVGGLSGRVDAPGEEEGSMWLILPMGRINSSPKEIYFRRRKAPMLIKKRVRDYDGSNLLFLLICVYQVVPVYMSVCVSV